MRNASLERIPLIAIPARHDVIDVTAHALNTLRGSAVRSQILLSTHSPDLLDLVDVGTVRVIDRTHGQAVVTLFNPRRKNMSQPSSGMTQLEQFATILRKVGRPMRARELSVHPELVSYASDEAGLISRIIGKDIRKGQENRGYKSAFCRIERDLYALREW